MIKTEYWKMKDSVFIKVSEDGIFKDSKSIPIEEVSNDILGKFEKMGGDYFFESEGDLELEAERNEMEAIPYSKSKIIDSTDDQVFEKSNQDSGSDKKDIESTAETLNPEHVGMENVKSNGPISSDLFQDCVISGSKHNCIGNITNTESVNTNQNNNTKEYDFVQAPSHYNGHTIITKGEKEFEYETIEFIESWLRRHSWMPEEAKYAAGNGLKYYDRVGNKPEDGKTREEKAAEDFEKISWYALRAAKALRGKLYRN